EGEALVHLAGVATAQDLDDRLAVGGAGDVRVHDQFARVVAVLGHPAQLDDRAPIADRDGILDGADEYHLAHDLGIAGWGGERDLTEAREDGPGAALAVADGPLHPHGLRLRWCRRDGLAADDAHRPGEHLEHFVVPQAPRP